MAISLFAAGSVPVDNSAQAGNLVSFTPPAGMQKGDVIQVIVLNHFTGFQPSWDDFIWTKTSIAPPKASGGQVWHMLSDGSLTADSATPANVLVAYRMFLARFNGSWEGDPGFDATLVTSMSIIYRVWRTDNPLKYLDYDVMAEGNELRFAAGLSPSLAGITTLTDSAVAYAMWLVPATNTWSGLTAGWTYCGPTNQFRNTQASNPMSMSDAYMIVGNKGATGAVVNTQSASTAGCSCMLALREVDVLATLQIPVVNLLMDVDGGATAEGSLITPAILDASTHPAQGSWTLSGSAPGNSTVSRNGERVMGQRALIASDGIVYERGRMLGMQYAHSGGAATGKWDFSLSPTQTRVSHGFFLKTSYPYAALDSFSAMAIFATGSGEYAVLNWFAQHADAHSIRLELGLGAQTRLGPRIYNNTWYWVSILIDVTAVARAYMAVFDPRDWSQIGFTVNFAAVNTNPINMFEVFCTGGTFAAHAGAFTQFDDVIYAWGANAIFPLFPGLKLRHSYTRFPPVGARVLTGV